MPDDARGQEQSGVSAEPAALLLGPPVLEGLYLSLGEAALPWLLVRLDSTLGPDADEDVQLPTRPQPTSCVDHEALVVDERQDVAAGNEIERRRLQPGRDGMSIEVVNPAVQPSSDALSLRGLDRGRREVQAQHVVAQRESCLLKLPMPHPTSSTEAPADGAMCRRKRLASASVTRRSIARPSRYQASHLVGLRRSLIALMPRPAGHLQARRKGRVRPRGAAGDVVPG